jgi:hypothetical protein
MATLGDKISALEAKIEGYEAKFEAAASTEDQRMYANLITERGKTLNALLLQQQQQSQGE